MGDLTPLGGSREDQQFQARLEKIGFTTGMGTAWSLRINCATDEDVAKVVFDMLNRSQLRDQIEGIGCLNHLSKKQIRAFEQLVEVQGSEEGKAPKEEIEKVRNICKRVLPTARKHNWVLSDLRSVCSHVAYRNPEVESLTEKASAKIQEARNISDNLPIDGNKETINEKLQEVSTLLSELSSLRSDLTGKLNELEEDPQGKKFVTELLSELNKIIGKLTIWSTTVNHKLKNFEYLEKKLEYLKKDTELPTLKLTKEQYERGERTFSFYENLCNALITSHFLIKTAELESSKINDRKVYIELKISLRKDLEEIQNIINYQPDNDSLSALKISLVRIEDEIERIRSFESSEYMEVGKNKEADELSQNVNLLKELIGKEEKANAAKGIVKQSASRIQEIKEIVGKPPSDGVKSALELKLTDVSGFQEELERLRVKLTEQMVDLDNDDEALHIIHQLKIEIDYLLQTVSELKSSIMRLEKYNAVMDIVNKTTERIQAIKKEDKSLPSIGASHILNGKLEEVKNHQLLLTELRTDLLKQLENLEYYPKIAEIIMHLKDEIDDISNKLKIWSVITKQKMKLIEHLEKRIKSADANLFIPGEYEYSQGSIGFEIYYMQLNNIQAEQIQILPIVDNEEYVKIANSLREELQEIKDCIKYGLSTRHNEVMSKSMVRIKSEIDRLKSFEQSQAIQPKPDGLQSQSLLVEWKKIKDANAAKNYAKNSEKVELSISGIRDDIQKLKLSLDGNKNTLEDNLRDIELPLTSAVRLRQELSEKIENLEGVDTKAKESLMKLKNEVDEIIGGINLWTLVINQKMKNIKYLEEKIEIENQDAISVEKNRYNTNKMKIEEYRIFLRKNAVELDELPIPELNFEEYKALKIDLDEELKEIEKLINYNPDFLSTQVLNESIDRIMYGIERVRIYEKIEGNLVAYVGLYNRAEILRERLYEQSSVSNRTNKGIILDKIYQSPVGVQSRYGQKTGKSQRSADEIRSADHQDGISESWVLVKTPQQKMTKVVSEFNPAIRDLSSVYSYKTRSQIEELKDGKQSPDVLCLTENQSDQDEFKGILAAKNAKGEWILHFWSPVSGEQKPDREKTVQEREDDLKKEKKFRTELMPKVIKELVDKGITPKGIVIDQASHEYHRWFLGWKRNPEATLEFKTRQ